MKSQFITNYSTISVQNQLKSNQSSRQYQSIVVDQNRKHPSYSNRPFTTALHNTYTSSRSETKSISNASIQSQQSLSHHFKEIFKGNNSDFFRKRFVNYVIKKKQIGLKQLIRKYAENPEMSINNHSMNYSIKALQIEKESNGQKAQSNILGSFPILTNAAQKVYRLLELKTEKEANFQYLKSKIRVKRGQKLRLFQRRCEVKPIQAEEWNMQWIEDNVKAKKRYNKRLSQMKVNQDSQNKIMLELRP